MPTPVDGLSASPPLIINHDMVMPTQVASRYIRVLVLPDDQLSDGEQMVQALIDQPFHDWIDNLVAAGLQPDGAYPAVVALWERMLDLVREDCPFRLFTFGRVVEKKILHSHAKEMVQSITHHVNFALDQRDEPRISPRSIYNGCDAFHEVCKRLYYKNAPLDKDQQKLCWQTPRRCIRQP